MIKVTYVEWTGNACMNNCEVFNESDVGTNISRAMQYAYSLKTMGGDSITNVKIVVDL